MKAIIIIYVALLPSIIHGFHAEVSLSSDEEEEVDVMSQARNTLQEMVMIGESISDIFKPLRPLDDSAVCIIYEGELIRNDNKKVAMKFSPSTVNYLEKEYEMYTYLKAISNATVENYGIAAVYYYGRWGRYRMLALTLLDKECHKMDWSDRDVMIILREFVRISKYMHSCGVFHSDTVTWNMMFRGNKGFMVDFGLAKKVSDRPHTRPDGRKYEWKLFLDNVCIFRKIFAAEVAALPERGFKRVLTKFEYYAIYAEKVDYDVMHDIITEEIRWLNVREPAMVSWLPVAQHDEATAEWERTPDIRAIPDPYTARFDYPAPNDAYFGSINAD